MVETQKKIEELKQTYLSWSLHDRDVRHAGIKEGMEQGIAIGEKRGEERGRSEAKLEAAGNMLLEGVPMDKIATWQALPLETVRELAGESNSIRRTI